MNNCSHNCSIVKHAFLELAMLLVSLTGQYRFNADTFHLELVQQSGKPISAISDLQGRNSRSTTPHGGAHSRDSSREPEDSKGRSSATGKKVLKRT